ncbi:MAG: ISAs1 family transposase [Bacteroidales bacterium]|nr:ISAs1 family transposase [Bacteroidales bacterium]
MENFKDEAVYDCFCGYFSRVSDPRQAHKISHLLSEVLFIIVIAIISGADDFQEIERYASTKRKWLSTFLKLQGGVPSHDTFNRVLCAIDPNQFQLSFIDWVGDIRNSVDPPEPGQQDIVSIDGKTVCNSADKSTGKKAIHMVSALSTQYGLVLGQKKCYEKSNEITAIPALLTLLAIKGAIVTIDAMGCQTKITSKIIKKGADYLIALKENQPNLYKEVTDMFEKIKSPEFAHYTYQTDTQTEKDHGRVETRECVTINNLGWLYETLRWEGIKSIAKITATVYHQASGKETVEERFYISSLSGNAALINKAVRTHWHIENKLHWILDVVFKEDYCRVRTGHGAENLTTIRKMALNMIKMETSDKGSFKGKRKRATWDDDYAMKIFTNMIA